MREQRIALDHSSVAAIELLEGQKSLTIFFFLKAFSSGAIALTGIEAVADGVPAFEKPEPKNASKTLMWMAVILGTSFFGLSLLAQKLEPLKDHEGNIKVTVMAQMAEQVYGGRNIFFFITQFATFGILILAANTAYADFPRLSSIIWYPKRDKTVWPILASSVSEPRYSCPPPIWMKA